jgi:hypothetical protein
MLQFVCHPSIENLLNTCREGMNCATLPVKAVIFSDYLPQVTSSPIHAGLLESVKYRLAQPTHLIYFASFLPKEKLLQHDRLGILSLTGTEFIHLPFDPNQFYVELDSRYLVECVIPETEWVEFATNACKTLLKEKLSILKHDDVHPFFIHSTLILPLYLEVWNYTNNLIDVEHLKSRLTSLVPNFTYNKEILELSALSNVSVSFQDEFLQTVSQFVKDLEKLSSYVSQEQININELSSDLHKLDNTYNKIITL